MKPTQAIVSFLATSLATSVPLHATTFNLDLTTSNTGGITLASGNNDFSLSASVDYLIVAGGGAGGGVNSANRAGGGGGAGGLLQGTGLSLTGSNAITVGAGGTSPLPTGSGAPIGTNGGNSVAFGLTAKGGGAGGTNSTINGVGGATVGSGGGGGNNSSSAGTGGTGLTGGQGNAGANSLISPTRFGGGGGGAGGAGSSATGGSGLSSSITGSSVTYAAGGSGLTVVAGTGSTTGTSAAANTGNGGGGAKRDTTAGAGNNAGGAGGSGIVVVSYAGTTTLFSGGTISTSGGKTIHQFTTTGASSLNLTSSNATINGDISGAGGNLLWDKTGTLTLGGTNTYTGTTTISSGTLALSGSGSIASSSAVIVGASTTFDVSAVSGGYTLGSTQTLSGTGTVTGAMTVSGTLSPGNSPGIQTTGNQTWVNGGDYNFQMLDATGLAGTGFDQIQVTGSLDLTSLTTGGFSINLWSLSSTGPDVSGNALNFNNAIDQSWIILTTSGGISGFDAADFLVNVGANNGTNGFLNALGGGSFSIDATSNNLVLNFTAIPEPRAALLGGLGLLMLLRRRRP